MIPFKENWKINSKIMRSKFLTIKIIRNNNNLMNKLWGYTWKWKEFNRE